jgi:hypothetical protein
MYSLSHHLYSQQNFDIKWIKCLKKILNETGFSNIWQMQFGSSEVRFSLKLVHSNM